MLNSWNIYSSSNDAKQVRQYLSRLNKLLLVTYMVKPDCMLQ